MSEPKPSATHDDAENILLMRFAGWLLGRLRLPLDAKLVQRHIDEFRKELEYDKEL